MSRTYNLICHDCKSELWIGQGWPETRRYIYTSKEHLADLERFLFKHERHRLEFLDSEIVDSTFLEEFTDESSDAEN